MPLSLGLVGQNVQRVPGVARLSAWIMHQAIGIVKCNIFVLMGWVILFGDLGIHIFHLLFRQECKCDEGWTGILCQTREY